MSVRKLIEYFKNNPSTTHFIGSNVFSNGRVHFYLHPKDAPDSSIDFVSSLAGDDIEFIPPTTDIDYNELAADSGGFNINVNGVDVVWDAPTISYTELLTIAYGAPQDLNNLPILSAMYSRGPRDNVAGSLPAVLCTSSSFPSSVYVQDGMVFSIMDTGNA